MMKPFDLMAMSAEDAARVQQYIETAPWTFAKSMPNNPHEYTVRGQTPDDDFEWFVRLIRAHGYKRIFRGTPYTCLDVGPRRYWTMGAPLPITRIINRAMNE